MAVGWILDLAERTAPILVFVLAITVIAELASLAGVFESAGALAERAGRGSVLRLWLVVVALASVTTVFLSLDTAAVLLTPVVVAAATRSGAGRWPLALGTVWIANTASLVLPISNLTTLLLVDRLQWSANFYLTRMWIPALVALTTSVLVLFVVLRGGLVGRYEASEAPRPGDPVLFWVGVGACLSVGPLFLLGFSPWVVAATGALLLGAATFVRDRKLITWSLVSWRLLAVTIALFLAVGALAEFNMLGWLATGAGSGSDLPDLLRLSFCSAVASNAINNLPAYLALEPAASASSERMLALLVGTNVGPLITVWASLATLLWRDRCRRLEAPISLWRFAAIGAMGVPVIVAATTTAVWATR